VGDQLPAYEMVLDAKSARASALAKK